MRLLVVCGVGNGKCRGQVTRIQERKQLKPHLMLAVCQLTDVGTVKCRDDDDGQVTRIQERKQLKPRPMLSVSAWRAYI